MKQIALAWEKLEDKNWYWARAAIGQLQFGACFTPLEDYYYCYINLPDLEVSYPRHYDIDKSVPIDTIKSFVDSILILAGYRLLEDKYTIII